MKSDYTEIVVLLDNSGSMSGSRVPTISGYNEFLKSQKEVKGKANLTLIYFDSIMEIKYTKDIYKTNELTLDEYPANGASTAYLDALGKTINITGEKLNAMPENERPDKVVFVVITDGMENASREYSKSKIKEMITHQESKYNWQFVFMGANMDAVSEGASLGVKAMSSFTYNQTAKGMANAYGALSDNLVRYRTGQALSVNFTEAQRAEQEEESKSV